LANGDEKTNLKHDGIPAAFIHPCTVESGTDVSKFIIVHMELKVIDSNYAPIVF
jgi:hypothetical protein